MKRIILFLMLSIILGCNSTTNPSTSLEENNTARRMDSLKWFFYAYTHEGKAVFEKDGKVYEFAPTECEIRIDRISNRNDTVFYLMNFYKEGYNYKKVYDGLMVNGFAYINGAFKPLTGMIKFDNFDNTTYLKIDNRRTDSIFKAFLRTRDSSKLSNWLNIEVRKRNVF